MNFTHLQSEGIYICKDCKNRSDTKCSNLPCADILLTVIFFLENAFRASNRRISRFSRSY